MLFRSYLGSQGAGYLLVDSAQLGNDVLRASVRAQLPDAVDLAVVLGGDGTILQTAHLLEGADVPVLGINFGRLGFLASGSDAGVVPLVAAALAGEAAVERRAALRVDVVCDGEPDPVEAGELPDVSSSCDDACRAEAARASLDDPHGGFGVNRQIGRASCRERV